MEYPICIAGIDYQVDDQFMCSLEIIKEDKIGDTYFITCKDNSNNFVFSISDKIYEILKLDNKINSILK